MRFFLKFISCVRRIILKQFQNDSDVFKARESLYPIVLLFPTLSENWGPPISESFYVGDLKGISVISRKFSQKKSSDHQLWLDLKKIGSITTAGIL